MAPHTMGKESAGHMSQSMPTKKHVLIYTVPCNMYDTMSELATCCTSCVLQLLVLCNLE